MHGCNWNTGEEKNSFKNMPRDFIQVFRGEITNTEVESQGEETVYEGATYVQKQQL